MRLRQALVSTVSVVLVAGPWATPALGATFTVNYGSEDLSDHDPSDDVCDTAAGEPQQCTLRAAIQQANATAGADTIEFAIETGPVLAVLEEELPGITTPMTIDGSTQPGEAGGTCVEETGAPCVTVLPFVEVISIFAISGSGVTIRGLSLGQGENAVIEIQGGAQDVVIVGNYIGVGIDGTTDQGGAAGIVVTSADRVTIGGATPADRNVIAGNGSFGGIVVSTSEATIKGNRIGTTADGTGPLPNEGGGIIVQGGSEATIGGTTPGARNLISGNGTGGIMVIDGSTAAIRGNYIGTAANGVTPLGNDGPGILVDSSTATVGGATAAAANRIRSNASDGIAVVDDGQVAILRNSISANGGLGIDLGDDGVTPNDVPGDGDTGPNELQNFPTVLSAIRLPDGTRVRVRIQSEPNEQLVLRFFHGPTCDPSQRGEGPTFLGQVSVSSGSDGDLTVTRKFGPKVRTGNVVTGTATDPDGNTSEFSKCRTVTAP